MPPIRKGRAYALLAVCWALLILGCWLVQPEGWGIAGASLVGCSAYIIGRVCGLLRAEEIAREGNDG